ncbi:N-acetylneuraminate lyase [subsurface metagenome]
MKKYKGIFPALVTPYTAGGEINGQALREIVKMNIEKRVNGFYVGGSTSEAFLLTHEERKEILKIVSDEARGKCTIIFHIGCINTDQAIDLAEYAQKVEVDAISSIPPFYYNFSLKEIKNYYKDIINQVDLPMIVYNFPAFSGVSFNSNNILDLLSDERIIGVKHTSYDLYQLERMKRINENLIIYNGHDEVFLAGLAMGADGGIGSTYNFMAEKFIMIKKLFEEGKHEDAKKLQIEANEIIKVLIEIGVIQGIKYALVLQGIDCGITRRPFKGLNEEEKDLLHNTLTRYLNCY